MPPSPPVARTLTATLELPALLPVAVELAAPPAPPVPVPLFTLPPLPPTARSLTLTELFPLAVPIEVLVEAPPAPPWLDMNKACLIIYLAIYMTIYRHLTYNGLCEVSLIGDIRCR